MSLEEEGSQFEHSLDWKSHRKERLDLMASDTALRALQLEQHLGLCEIFSFDYHAFIIFLHIFGGHIGNLLNKGT